MFSYIDGEDKGYVTGARDNTGKANFKVCNAFGGQFIGLIEDLMILDRPLGSHLIRVLQNPPWIPVDLGMSLNC